jgi:hypothetical protein
MALRPELQAIVDRLVRTFPSRVQLETLADALGPAPVTPDEIGEMIDALEAKGCSVGDPDAPPASRVLHQVLLAARGLRRSLGRTPTAQEIAVEAGLSSGEVRLALLFAQVLQR